jgi:hypothetical protein
MAVVFQFRYRACAPGLAATDREHHQHVPPSYKTSHFDGFDIQDDQRRTPCKKTSTLQDLVCWCLTVGNCGVPLENVSGNRHKAKLHK